MQPTSYGSCTRDIAFRSLRSSSAHWRWFLWLLSRAGIFEVSSSRSSHFFPAIGCNEPSSSIGHGSSTEASPSDVFRRMARTDSLRLDRPDTFIGRTEEKGYFSRDRQTKRPRLRSRTYSLEHRRAGRALIYDLRSAGAAS